MQRTHSTRAFIWAVVFTFLAVRVGDTHLHLCFDGQETAASMHFADASVHHDDYQEGDGHADKDVNPFLGAFVKKGDDQADLALLAVVVILGLLVPAFRDELPLRSPQLHGTDSSFKFRPPLRGPPF